MKYLFAILIMFATSMSYANLSVDAVSQAGFRNLTPEQQAEVISNITKMNVNQPVMGDIPENINPEKIDKWVELGEHVGKALSGAAKELGIAANEFAKTPLGMITISMVVWYIFGNGALHFIVGLIFLYVALKFARKIHAQIANEEVSYDSAKTDWFGRSLKLKEKTSISQDGAWGVVLTHLIILALFCLIVFTGTSV